MQKDFKIMFYIAIVYILLSIIFGLAIHSFLHLMMGWNMLLALIPFAITFFIKRSKNIEPYIFILIFILWLLFFPNSFYFLTDLIHITKLDIYVLENNQFVYNEDIIEWLKFTHLMLGAIAGAFLGLTSLYQMHIILSQKQIKYLTPIIIVIIFLSSIGIYIGRFLRFNSWDIFNPFLIIKTLIIKMNLFGLLFILLFFLIMLILYYLFYHLIKKRFDENN